jgi:hypothetical protein
MRHGPHQGAQKSTTTGSRESLTSASKADALGTSIGSLAAGSGEPQCPHFASRPYGTLFRCPHDAQLKMTPFSSMSMLLIRTAPGFGLRA